jgi:hypothetical protein
MNAIEVGHVHGGMVGAAMLGVLLTALIVVVVVVLWVLPIVLGIRCARRKHYAPQWMWFGIHPLGGWIAFLVLASLPMRLVCGNCGGYVDGQFRLCPYCHASMSGPANAPAH